MCPRKKKKGTQGHFKKQVTRRWPIYCFHRVTSLGETRSKTHLNEALGPPVPEENTIGSAVRARRIEYATATCLEMKSLREYKN